MLPRLEDQVAIPGLVVKVLLRLIQSKRDFLAQLVLDPVQVVEAPDSVAQKPL